MGDVLIRGFGVLIGAAWLWGIWSYAAAGNFAGAIGALLLPPMGVAHGLGLF